jgi:hypothetical protein
LAGVPTAAAPPRYVDTDAEDPARRTQVSHRGRRVLGALEIHFEVLGIDLGPREIDLRASEIHFQAPAEIDLHA